MSFHTTSELSSPRFGMLISAFSPFFAGSRLYATNHADNRISSKEGLGFREARGAARYGALAVGVGLW
jgi:hypothetical protein